MYCDDSEVIDNSQYNGLYLLILSLTDVLEVAVTFLSTLSAVNKTLSYSLSLFIKMQKAKTLSSTSGLHSKTRKKLFQPSF